MSLIQLKLTVAERDLIEAVFTSLQNVKADSAAIAGGLTAGAFYRTNGDPDTVCVVH